MSQKFQNFPQKSLGKKAQIKKKKNLGGRGYLMVGGGWWLVVDGGYWVGQKSQNFLKMVGGGGL